MKYIDIYGKIELPEAFTAEENQKYCELVKNGNEDAKKKLQVHNIRLIIHIVMKKYYSFENELEDLITIGILGLIKAIDSFDIDRGFNFSTYAGRCINNEILMYLRKKENNNSKKVSLDEILNKNIDRNNHALLDKLSDDYNITEDIELNETYKEIRQALLILSESERRIIEMSYGFGCEPMTQKQIEEELKIRQSYISRIDKKARIKIKKYMESKGICSNYEVGYKNARSKIKKIKEEDKVVDNTNNNSNIKKKTLTNSQYK